MDCVNLSDGGALKSQARSRAHAPARRLLKRSFNNSPLPRPCRPSFPCSLSSHLQRRVIQRVNVKEDRGEAADGVLHRTEDVGARVYAVGLGVEEFVEEVRSEEVGC